MLNFGNLRPMGSKNDKLLLCFVANSPYPYAVELKSLPAGNDVTQWVGNPMPPGNVHLMQTGHNSPDRLYLTMRDDKPNEPTYMEKWLGPVHGYDPRQVSIPIKWEGNQRSFLTTKGHILQATNVNEQSQVIVGAYPENNSHDPTPKTSGQIWLCTGTG